jgi:hypothetical protein
VKNVTITLRVEDAEPILREAARNAAMYSSYIDYITNKTYHFSLNANPYNKERWQERFLSAKRLVEAFGMEYEQVSEGETLTVYIPDKVLKAKNRYIAGLGTVREILKSKPDFKNPQPAYRGEVHGEACRQAADRVVRKWKLELEKPNPRSPNFEEAFGFNK